MRRPEVSGYGLNERGRRARVSSAVLAKARSAFALAST
jgi:hypothetical protein